MYALRNHFDAGLFESMSRQRNGKSKGEEQRLEQADV